MKVVYLFLLVILISPTAYAQYANLPYDDGPVLPNKRLVANRITVEKAYAYRFGKNGISDSALLWTKFYYYNLFNQLIRQEQKTEGSKLQSYTKYAYNNYGLVAKHVEVTVRSKAKTDSVIYEYGYDTLANQRFIYKYNKDTTNLHTTEKIYNSKHQVISVLLKIEDGEFFTIRNLTYTENGDLSALEYLDGSGNTTVEYSFNYDYPARKRIVYTITNGKKKLYQAYTYSINKDCLRLEQFNYVDPKNEKGAIPTQTTKYYYDDKGLLGNEVVYDGSDLSSFVKHFYSQ
jgi:hypothetical protein